MSFLSHLGATAYKYEIELVLVNLRLSALQTAPIWIEWKRGSSQAKSSTVPGEKGFYDFGKKAMKITSTMYKKKEKYQKKESRLTVKQQAPKGKEVVIGFVDLNLADYVQTSDVSESLTLNLQKCSDKQARLTFRLNTHWLKGAEIDSDDEMSRSTNFSTLSGSQENSTNESPPARGEDLHDLDALENSHATGSDDDEEAEDARRRTVKFNSEKLGRTSREGSVEAKDLAPPKKSALKGSPSASPPAVAPSKRAPPPPTPESDEDQQEDDEEEEAIPLFGVSLAGIMSAQSESFPDLDVPVILDVLLRGIERTGGLTTEGIFRVSPLKKATDDLRAKFVRGEFQLPKDATVSASLLKAWLAELKDSVIPEKLLALVLEAGKTAPTVDDDPDDSESDEEYARRKRGKKQAAAGADGLRSVLAKLPMLNARVLSKLVHFLAKVCLPANVAKNKMSPQALAVVFAPSLVKQPMADAAKAGQDMKRVVNFVHYLLLNKEMVELAAQGELKNAPTPTDAASMAAAMLTAKPVPKKAPPPPVSESEEEASHSEKAQHTDQDDDDPLPSFAHSVDLGELSEEDQPPPPAKNSAKAKAEEAAKKKADEEAAAAAAAAAKKKQPPAKKPSYSDDESDDEPPVSRRQAAAATAKPAASAAAAGAKAATGRRGRSAADDDDDDSEEEELKRNELFKKKGLPAPAAALPPKGKDSPTNKSSSVSHVQSLKDQLFAKKTPPAGATSSAGASSPKVRMVPAARKEPPAKDDTDSDEEEPIPTPAAAPAAQSLKDLLFARKSTGAPPPAASPKGKKPTDEPAKAPEKKSARAAFGEETDEDDEPAPAHDDHGFEQHSESEVEEEETPRSKAKNRLAQPPPPQPSPSPRSAIAALSATAASRGKDKGFGTSASPSNAELASLREQVAKLEKEKQEAAEHIRELEAEATHAADAAGQVASLEKENKRLKGEVADLQKSLEASSSSSAGVGGSSKQVDQLKKQVASLIAEKDDALADYDELEKNYAELRKANAEAKKAQKAQANEIEDLKEQLAEALSGGASVGAKSKASRSVSGGTLDEQKLREEYSLLQLQFEDVKSELSEKLDAERKLTRSLQAQLVVLQKESESLRARELTFADLSVIPAHIDPSKNKKDKLQMDLIEAYKASQQRNKFLAQQLKECDATLLHAKQGWSQTVGVLQEQIVALEQEVGELKLAAAHASANTPFDVQQFDHAQKKLRKSEQARGKMTELLASMEVDLNKKKVEVKTALQSIIDLQQDNARIKEELVRSGLALKTIAEDNFELKEYMRLSSKGKK